MTAGPDLTLDEAAAAARAAAERAGVAVRPLLDTADLADLEALLTRVWRHPPGSVELDISLLTAVARTGNYVVGAFRDGTLVGGSVGFRAEPFPVTLYSHVTGVDHELAAAGTGTALKAYQRVWCLEQGVTQVRWTFDPLQSRNAYLNIHRLGARPIAFHQDYYGSLRDGLNRDFGSDRLLVEWRVARRPAGEADTGGAVAVLSPGAGGEPVVGPVPESGWCRVEIPEDIDEIRARDPNLARRWRDGVRTVLGGLMGEGWEVIDVDRSGAYTLRSPS